MFTPTLKYQTSDRDKKCRLCNQLIEKNTWCIVMKNIHVPPKHVDLFFHEDCFTKAFEEAKKEQWLEELR
jgi:hypothetical protein